MRATCLVLALILFLGGTAVAANVTIAWDASPSPLAVGYNLYYSTDLSNMGTPTNCGNVLQYGPITLPDNTRYYIYLTAYDSDANESVPSRWLIINTATGTTGWAMNAFKINSGGTLNAKVIVNGN